MPETFYTSSQYYNLFFQMYVNGGLPFALRRVHPRHAARLLIDKSLDPV